MFDCVFISLIIVSSIITFGLFVFAIIAAIKYGEKRKKRYEEIKEILKNIGKDKERNE